MPLIDPNHISPTGSRIVPPQVDIMDSDLPYPEGFPQLALQRYLGEKSRRKMAEAQVDELTTEVSRLRDAMSERDAEIDTLRTMIADEDK